MSSAAVTRQRPRGSSLRPLEMPWAANCLQPWLPTPSPAGPTGLPPWASHPVPGPHLGVPLRVHQSGQSCPGRQPRLFMEPHLPVEPGFISFSKSNHHQVTAGSLWQCSGHLLFCHLLHQYCDRPRGWPPHPGCQGTRPPPGKGTEGGLETLVGLTVRAGLDLFISRNLSFIKCA